MINTVPVSRLVVARIRALHAANRKQVNMIMPALMLTMPSGSIRCPVASIPRMNFQNPDWVPCAPNKASTIGCVFTQSSMCLGRTSHNMGNISHQTEKIRRYKLRCGFRSSFNDSSARFCSFSLPCRILLRRARRSSFPGSR